jgi:serine/threonine protein kinase
MRAVEKLCMTQPTHRNIVSVFEYGRLGPFLYYIDMELCQLNLNQWIYGKWNDAEKKELPFLTAELPPRMRMGQVWDIMEDITQAVAFIHNAHEVHRDLKPSNGL